MDEAAPRWPTRQPATPAGRDPDQLLRDARAIRRLLDGLAPDEHAARIRLVAAQDVVRLEAAQQWHARGWRPITEAVVVARRQRTLLLAPALAGAAAAVLSARYLGASGPLVTVLALLTVAPLLAEARGSTQAVLRRWAAIGSVAIGWHLFTGALPATLAFLPAGLLLAAITAAGTVPGGSRDLP